MEFDFSEVLTRMVSERASDVHLTSGFPPAIRVRGRITPMEDYPALGPQQTREVVYSILNDDQRKRFENNKQLDLAYSIPGVGRFRINAYFQRGVRFDEGWIGFGSRIHRADFKRLALIGAPLELESFETKARIQPDRHVVRYEFTFKQDGKVCYWGDQTATWLRGRSFEEE